MNKKSILYMLLALVFLVVFNTAFFVIGGTEHTASVWVSYGFIHFSYVMVLITPLLVRKSSSAAIFGFSLSSISSTYFVLEFIVGLVFIFVNSESYKPALITQIILAGIYLILLISNMIANENTADSLEKHEDEVAYIKNASSRVKMLVGKAEDKKANKEIERVYDLLHSSPTHSIFAVKIIEDKIRNMIFDLENAVSANDSTNIIAISSELVSLIEERNREIMTSN